MNITTSSFFKNSYNQRKIQVLFLMTLWSVAMLTMQSINKGLKNDVSLYMITFARYFFGTLYLLPFLKKSDFKNIKYPALHMTRVIIASVSIFLTYACQRNLDMTFANIIGRTEPIMISVLAMIFLSEKISLNRWIAIVIACFGAIIAINPQWGGTFNQYVVFCIMANLLCSISSIILKKLTQNHRPVFLVFSVSAFSLIISTIISFYKFQMPSPIHVCLMVVMALSAICANLCMTKAYKIADASFVGSLGFLKIIISIPFEFILFCNTPTQNTIVGGLLIFTAYMILIKTKSIKPHKC